MQQIIIIISLTLFAIESSAQSDYPIPQDREELLFYIQRNHNKNTIIYDANFDKDGNLNKVTPIDVYWVRYEEQGQRMALRTIEKWYAYGVNCTQSASTKNKFEVKLVASEKRKFWLKQKAPFDAALYTMINNKVSELHHLYIFADSSGLWPTVKYIELFGKDLSTGKASYERINP